MESRVLFSGQFTNLAIFPRQTRQASLAPFAPLRRSCSFVRCLEFDIDRFSMRVGLIRPINSIKSAAGDDIAVISEEKKGSGSGTKRKKLAVFVSGGGSNFKAIHEGCVDGLVHGDVSANGGVVRNEIFQCLHIVYQDTKHLTMGQRVY